MLSALYLTTAAPTDPSYYVVCQLQDGRYAVHAAPNAPAPNGATTVCDGSVAPWQWSDLLTIAPAIANQLLECTYRDLLGQLQRCAIAALPIGMTLVDTNLPPHFWME